VGPDLGAVEFEDQVREAVDHGRHAVEAGRGVDHAEHPHPGADAVEVAEGALQAAEDAERCQACRFIALLDAEFAPDLAQRQGESAVAGGRTVARYERPPADQPDPRKGQHHTGRQLGGRRQRQAEVLQFLLDACHQSFPLARTSATTRA